MDEASDDENDPQKTGSEGESDEDIDFESEEDEPRSGGKYNVIMYLCTIKAKLKRDSTDYIDLSGGKYNKIISVDR